jgi:hypothetical protein
VPQRVAQGLEQQPLGAQPAGRAGQRAQGRTVTLAHPMAQQRGHQQLGLQQRRGQQQQCKTGLGPQAGEAPDGAAEPEEDHPHQHQRHGQCGGQRAGPGA